MFLVVSSSDMRFGFEYLFFLRAQFFLSEFYLHKKPGA